VAKEEDMSDQATPRGDLDVVVIGSGIGGLVAAALLARLEGKRVLVLERHYRAGGFTHTFSRPGGFRWDVGVHYVGSEVLTPGVPRDALRVASGGALAWSRMPDPFERLVFPGFELALRAGRQNLIDDLTRAFPAEARSIRAWLEDVDRACGLLPLQVARGAVPAPVRWALDAATAGRARLAGTRTGDYLARRFADPRLRAVVAARWGDHGLPPGESAFFAHAVITRHYLEGAVYPVGSAARIAETMGSVIAAEGGEVRVRAEVERILVEGGRAVGVRLRGGEEIRARAVISDAGARNTYLRLLPEEAAVPFRAALAAEPPGAGMVSLYLGLSGSPATLGVRGENVWLHRGLDHDAAWAARGRLVEGEVDQAYVSFPSLKDPEAEVHTAEILAVADPASFQRWRDTRWMRRGEEYEVVKERIANALLARAEERLPGLRRLVVHRELSTPLSSAHFTGHPGGEVYGLPWRAGPFRRPWRSARTPVKGLYLAGADAVFLGVVGAAVGGVAAASALAGAGLLRRLARASRELGEPAGSAAIAAAAAPA
jgi:all-trans-retinol 13,14-reductase